MMSSMSRVKNELEHGRMLTQAGAEDVWGWGTPAGKVRANRRAQLILEAAKVRIAMSVLEVGCGNGNFTQRFMKSGGNILAVDVSPDLIVQAQERNLSDSQVKFLCAPFEEVELKGPFEAIIGSSVLHHLDLMPSLEKMYFMLTPGGRFAFAEPNMLNPQVFAERHFRSFFPQVSPDETAFVRRRLTKQLQDVGFQQVIITPFDWLHPAVPKKLINLVSRMGYIIEKIPLLCEFSGSLLISAVK